MKKQKKEVDSTTEEKIKEAARVVFTRKGYAAARTRDIAEEAGINLALLNYYFRSKEKLFDIIMMENIQRFIVGAKEILADEDTSLKDKTEKIASRYIDMLILNPDLPLFILSELRANPDQLVDKMGVKTLIAKSNYFQQLKDAAKMQKVNPMHYFMNTMALIVFPFVASPMIMNIGNLKQADFIALMQERKKLIAKWVEAIVKAK
ncbi:MAG TPA: TetR/AcrR family transcriptional regulator [Cyclobacteriaceae bacterium]|nr:TetR/AcrR family transcriptional regulator [Cyclobacteriaceae bacterium]